MTTKALSSDAARRAALEDCENRIRSACRRGLMATCDIAKELARIYKDELYTVKTQDFEQYITDHLHYSERTYRRIISVSQTVTQLQDAGLALPTNQSQVEELSRLEPPMRPKIWNELLLRFEHEQEALTVRDIKSAVEAANRAAAAPAQIEIAMDQEDEDDQEEEDSGNGNVPAKSKSKVVQEAVIVWSEQGEAALKRIRKVCGAEIADAISNGSQAMTERDLRNWAEFDDTTMRQLVYFLFDQQFTLSKAVSFLNKPLDDSTDVRALLLIAHSRGGSATINFDNRAQITVELLAKKRSKTEA